MRTNLTFGSFGIIFVTRIIPGSWTMTPRSGNTVFRTISTLWVRVITWNWRVTSVTSIITRNTFTDIVSTINDFSSSIVTINTSTIWEIFSVFWTFMDTVFSELFTIHTSHGTVKNSNGTNWDILNVSRRNTWWENWAFWNSNMTFSTLCTNIIIDTS
jgi:hypothetical protein